MMLEQDIGPSCRPPRRGISLDMSSSDERAGALSDHAAGSPGIFSARVCDEVDLGALGAELKA